MDQPLQTPTFAQFAGVIAKLGLTSFGGGISGWMLRIVVNEKRWMTEPDFLSGLALCQVIPGINVLNLSIWLGYRLHGLRGAIVGAAAMLVPPGLVILALASAFTSLVHNAPIRAALDGVAAAAIGLSASTGIRAARRCLAPLPAAFMLGTLLAIGVLNLPLLAVMLVLVPLSVALAWRRAG